MLELDNMLRNREGYGGTLAAHTMPMGMPMGMYQGQIGGAQTGNGLYPTGGHPFGGYPGNGSSMGQQFGNYYDGSMAEFGAHMTMASSTYSGMPHAASPDQQQQLGSVQQLPVPEDSRDLDDPPITPPPARERFSYTRYQLEMLNAIFLKVRYPNTIQKQLIAKRVGITRDQVKIWFQNRRRKDVVANQKAADGIVVEQPRFTPPEVQMVPTDVMSGVLRELVKYDGDYKKALKMKSKAKSKSAADRAKPYDASNSSHQRNRSDSQGYDTSPKANSMSSGGSPGYDYDTFSHFNKSPGLACNLSIPDMYSATSPDGFHASLSSTFSSSTPSTGYHSNHSSPPHTALTPSAACQHSANTSDSSSPPTTHGQTHHSPYSSSPVAIDVASSVSPDCSQNGRSTEDQLSKSVSPANEGLKHALGHSIPSNEQLDMVAPPNAVAPQEFDLPPFPLSALESPKDKSPRNESEKSEGGSPCHEPATSSSPNGDISSSESLLRPMPAATSQYSWHFPTAYPRSAVAGAEHTMPSQYPHHMAAYPPNQTIPPNFHGYGGFGEVNMRSYSAGNDSKVNLDRVFPFPLVAEQAMRFSSFPAYTPEGYGSAMKTEAPSGAYRDHFQPLLIASYANSYYGHDNTKSGEQ